MLVIKIEDDKGKLISMIIANEKTFKTGSRGYYGVSKGEIDGKRYQIQVQAVEIGSKNK